MQRSGPVLGVFDSGFGGLTVLRALLPRIPGAHYIYLGDTARLPYGAKSQATIARYAVESARFLEERGAEYLVIACNTATALALPEIRAAVSIPVLGVIDPVVQAAQQRHPNGNVLVLATTATVHSHAYAHACEAHSLLATEKACPLLVPLVEEGWIDHAVTRDVLRIYLTEALAAASPQAVLLGCTHYPLIASEITAMLRNLGSQAEVIDSAEATATEVARTVQSSHPEGHRDEGPATPESPAVSTFECYATDSIEKFQRLGSLFLGQPIPKVELLDLGG
jgi:glutamate racemase